MGASSWRRRALLHSKRPCAMEWTKRGARGGNVGVRNRKSPYGIRIGAVWLASLSAKEARRRRSESASRDRDGLGLRLGARHRGGRSAAGPHRGYAAQLGGSPVSLARARQAGKARTATLT